MKITVAVEEGLEDTEITINCRQVTPNIEKMVALLRMMNQQMAVTKDGENYLLNEGKIVEYGAPAEICRRYNHQKKINIHLKDGQDIVLEHDRECGERVKFWFMNGQVETIHSTEPDLEKIFMELTGKNLA